MSKEITHITQLDERTMEVLFKTYFRRLVLFAIRYVNDEDSAKEIVHDVFIRVWEKRESITAEKSVKSYLYTSVYNRSLNHLRDQKKMNTEVSVDDDRDLHDSQMADFDDLIEQNELQTAIEKALQQLPEKCREVFLMSRQDDMKYGEISETLGISVKTVEAQMSKALKILRNALDEYLTLYFLILFWIWHKGIDLFWCNNLAL